MKKKSKQKKVRMAFIRLSWVLLFALIEIVFFDSSLLDETVQSHLPTTFLDFNSLKMTLEISVVLMGVVFEFFRFSILQKKLKRSERKRNKATTIRRRVIILRRVRA